MPSDHQSSPEDLGVLFLERLAMHTGVEQASKATSGVPEDDMKEGDLGDGLGRKPGGLYERRRGRGEAPEPLPRPGLPSGRNGSVAFSWKSCRALYSTFHQEPEVGLPRTSWKSRSAESLSGLSCEELRQRLQEVSEEVELLHCELEATQRHLEGKHEALKILQGRAMFDQATTHTKTLLQKSEERNKALEKDVSAMQWEITFNQVQFKNLERSWKEKHDRLCSENQALKESLEDRLRELRELKSENSSLSQQCQELVSLLSVQEKKAFQGSQPPNSNLAGDGTALELAVLGACHCSDSVRARCPCSCAKTAAASRKQVLQLKQELEVQRRRKEEAFMMADAFRIAFEQQLRRKSDHVMRLAEAEGYLRKEGYLRSPSRKEEAVKGGLVSMAQKLKGMLQNCADVKMSDEPADMLRNVLDLLNDKEEALAHQRKVSYMLARHSEELEHHLLQLRGHNCEVSGRKSEHEGWDSGSTDVPIPGPRGNFSTESPSTKPSETQRNPSVDVGSSSVTLSKTQESPSANLESPSSKPSEIQGSTAADSESPGPKPSKTQGGAEEDSDSQAWHPVTEKPFMETVPSATSEFGGGFEDRGQQRAKGVERRSDPG